LIGSTESQVDCPSISPCCAGVQPGAVSTLDVGCRLETIRSCCDARKSKSSASAVCPSACTSHFSDANQTPHRRCGEGTFAASQFSVNPAGRLTSECHTRKINNKQLLAHGDRRNGREPSCSRASAVPGDCVLDVDGAHPVVGPGSGPRQSPYVDGTSCPSSRPAPSVTCSRVGQRLRV
jgi:hypothetical protein